MGESLSVERPWVPHSLRILARLSCIPQVSRYEYYVSRGEHEKAYRVVEESIRDLIKTRGYITEALRRIESIEREVGGSPGSVLEKRGLVRDLVGDMNRWLEDLPWTVSGCQVLRIHTEALLYKLSLTVSSIGSTPGLSIDTETLMRQLRELREHLSSLLDLIPGSETDLGIHRESKS